MGEYVYNGLGQRVLKTTAAGTTVFHYDFDGNIIAESGTDGTFRSEYLYVGGNRMARVDYNPEKAYFYLNDYLGTPLLLADDAATVTWDAEHETGRYLTPDLIGLDGGINFYTYTANNPINATETYGF